jgi:hypothetical protein
MVTCYKMISFPLFRRDRFAAECEEILSDCRDRGVIRAETCRRLVDAIRADGETIRKLER